MRTVRGDTAAQQPSRTGARPAAPRWRRSTRSRPRTTASSPWPRLAAAAGRSWPARLAGAGRRLRLGQVPDRPDDRYADLSGLPEAGLRPARPVDVQHRRGPCAAATAVHARCRASRSRCRTCRPTPALRRGVGDPRALRTAPGRAGRRRRPFRRRDPAGRPRRSSPRPRPALALPRVLRRVPRRRPRRTPYTSAEQVRDALRAAGAEGPHQIVTYSTGHGRPRRRRRASCNAAPSTTPSASLEQMEAAPVLGDYLAGCRDDAGAYSFDHEVMLLWL